MLISVIMHENLHILSFDFQNKPWEVAPLSLEDETLEHLMDKATDTRFKPTSPARPCCLLACACEHLTCFLNSWIHAVSEGRQLQMMGLSVAPGNPPKAHLPGIPPPPP